ncbi:Os05g0291600, partial [Oryza sativa Japonica Group]
VHGELAAVDPAAPIKEIRCCAWRTKIGRPWEIVLCIYDFPQHRRSPCTKQFQFNHVLRHLFLIHQRKLSILDRACSSRPILSSWAT